MALKLPFKKLRNLSILALPIIIIAVYFSTTEGFQTINSSTIDSLLQSVSTPSWFTIERHSALIKNTALFNSKKDNTTIIAPYNKLLSDTFNASKGAGDKDDITFDKLMAAESRYLNSFSSSNTPAAIDTSTNIGNIINYIAIGTGILIIGGIAYYMD